MTEGSEILTSKQAKERRAAERKATIKADNMALRTLQKPNPMIVTDDLLRRLIDWVSRGKSVRDFLLECAELSPGRVPSRASIFAALDKRPDTKAEYMRAKLLGLEEMHEEILSIADDASKDLLKDGKPNSTSVQRARLRIDARAKYLSNQDSMRFGDKVVFAGDKDNPLVFKLSHLERMKRIDELLALSRRARKGEDVSMVTDEITKGVTGPLRKLLGIKIDNGDSDADPE